MPFQLQAPPLSTPTANTGEKSHSALHLRLLSEQDRNAASRHLHALDSNDRYARFGSPLGNEALRRYVDSLDFVRHALFGVVCRKGDLRDELAGLLHLVPCGHQAELGASVLPDYRGQGLASALFAAALGHCRHHAIPQIVCVSGHPAVPRISRRIECGLRPWLNSGWLLLP